MMNGFLRRMIRAAVKRRRKQSARVPSDVTTLAALSASPAPSLLESLEERILMSFDPSASEQFMLELLNRMRMDPAGELPRLTTTLGTPATSSDADVNAALDFFNVNGTLLAEQWALLSAVPPLAWNESLINVADAHNQAMIAADVQSHEAPGEPLLANGGLRTRFNNQGYNSQSTIGENIFAFSESVFHGHAGLAIDWGSEGAIGGIQNPAGHRDSMMSDAFREVGIKITEENDNGTDVGPLVITQNFGGVEGAQPFLLGVAFNDADDDEFYDIGEGLGGVNVNILGINGTTGEFNVTTMSAGGWQHAVAPGTYRVTFSGGGLAQTMIRDGVVVGDDNVKIDSLVPEIDVQGNSVSIVDGDSAPSATDHTSFGNVHITNATLTRTFTIRNTGGFALNLTGIPRVAISGTHAGDFSVTVLPSSSVDPDGLTTFEVTFNPSATGLRTATVTILSDDSDESIYDFAISGTGVNPEVDIRGNSVSIADGDVTPATTDFTDFRQVPVSSTALTFVTRTFTIHNSAATDLSLTGTPRVQISGADASDFVVTTQPASATVPGGGSTTFVITFNPSAAGLRTATVTVLSDDTDEAIYDFAIQGTGIVTTTPPSGLQSATLVEGTGSGAVAGQGLRMFYTGYLTTGQQFDSNVGGNAFNFTLGAGSVISGWDQGLVGIKIGEKRTLVIPANLAYGANPPSGSGIPANAPLIFEVERIAPDIAVTSPQGSTVVPIVSGDMTPSVSDHTDFGFVTLGDGQPDFNQFNEPVGVPDGTVSWSFRITATGALNLTGSPRVAISGADAGAFSVVTQPATPIVPGSGQTTASRDFTILFNPTKLGTHSATVSIASDDPDENPYTFVIQGTGIANRIDGAVEDTDFVVTHAMLNAAMRESGTSAYLIDSVELGVLLKDGVPVIPGVTTLSSGQSLTWRAPANANRTLDAFRVKSFVGGVGVGTAELIRVEVTPADDAPVGTVSDIVLPAGGPSATQIINLASLFNDPDITGTVARITTSLGAVDVHLFNSLTPLTVANFLNYATGGDYNNTIIHRVVREFIVQGGGFKPQLPASHITTDPAVANEFGVSAQRGTISMAKSGNQINSATSEWFFNLGDNAANLDNQNGGFTVFGEVIGNGMTIVDAIAATPLFTDGQTLTALPLRNYAGGAVQDSNWVKTQTVTTISPLAFSVVGNTNAALVTPTLTNGSLSLAVAAGQAGSSDLTVRVTDLGGNSMDVTFTLSVVGVSVEAVDPQAAEPLGQQAANTGTFRISRSGPMDQALTVNYTIGGTASNGVDYEALPLSAIIPAGQSFIDVVVNPLVDANGESIETVVLAITSSANYTITDADEATVSIFDDKPIVAITAVDADAAETNAGQAASTGLFAFTRSGDLSEALTVHFTIGGTATNGTDYSQILQSIVIPANESSVTLLITPQHDTLSEANETVTLSLAADSQYVVDNDADDATVTITDNDPVLVQIAIIDADVAEEEPLSPGVVRISRTGATTAALIVKFTRGGKATFGPTGDYTLSLGQTNLTVTTVAIPAGESFVDININVLDDAKPDVGETILFAVAAGTGYTIPALVADRTVTLTIADNEPVISVAAIGFDGADAAGAETDNGQALDRPFFRISREGSTDAAVKVKITLSGTAKKNGVDYNLFVGGVALTELAVIIPAGADHIDLFIDPVNDQISELMETVIIKLAANKALYSLSPIAANLTATATIADNEPFVSVASLGFTGADAEGAETHTGEAANTARFRISRTTTGPAITVKFKMIGTAKRGATGDYVLTVNGVIVTSDLITIPAGATFVDVVLVPNNDTLPEAAETAILTLSVPLPSYRLDADLADRTATVTILDNEPTVSVVALDPTAAEPGGDGNTGRFRISRTGSTATALNVTFKIAGTATGGTDYVKLGTVVTIPAGAAFIDIDIEPLMDALAEQPETVTLTLAAGKTYKLDVNALAGAVTITDGAVATGADLVILAATVPAKTFRRTVANTAVKFSATIKNQGTDATAAATQVRVLLSKNRTAGAEDIELGTIPLGILLTGKSATVSGSFNITGLGLLAANDGAYYVLFEVDNSGVVAETIETNNTFATLLANVLITA